MSIGKKFILACMVASLAIGNTNVSNSIVSVSADVAQQQEFAIESNMEDIVDDSILEVEDAVEEDEERELADAKPTNSTKKPTQPKTSKPTKLKTAKPTKNPVVKTDKPTKLKTEKPTVAETAKPTKKPKTLKPTAADPSVESIVDDEEDIEEEEFDLVDAKPTNSTKKPTQPKTSKPTKLKTAKPTKNPVVKTDKPTKLKTEKPTVAETAKPTKKPKTLKPTAADPSVESIVDDEEDIEEEEEEFDLFDAKPTNSTKKPTKLKTSKPTKLKTAKPTKNPVVKTAKPTIAETAKPTKKPKTLKPTAADSGN